MEEDLKSIGISASVIDVIFEETTETREAWDLALQPARVSFVNKYQHVHINGRWEERRYENVFSYI